MKNINESSLENQNIPITLNQNESTKLPTIVLNGSICSNTITKTNHQANIVKKASPVNYVLTKGSLIGNSVPQLIAKPITIPKETNIIQETKDFPIKNVSPLGQIRIQNIKNGIMKGEIVNQVILKKQAAKESLPAVTISSLKSGKPTPAIIIKSNPTQLNNTKVTTTAAATITTGTGIARSNPIRATVINAPMSQTQIQQQTVLTSLPSQLTTGTIPNLANCTIITTHPAKSETHHKDPLANVNSSTMMKVTPLSGDLEVGLPVSLPPDLDLFLTDSASLKALPKPEDIIPETTITSSGTIPINLNSNFKVNELPSKIILNNSGRNLFITGLPNNCSSTLEKSNNNNNNNNNIIKNNKNHSNIPNNIIQEVINKTKFVTNSNTNGTNIRQVKVVKKTETNSPSVPNHMVSNNGTNNVNKKAPIVLTVTSSPASKKSNSAATISNENSQSSSPSSSSSSSSSNGNNNRSLLASKVIEFGTSPRKRAKSLQTESVPHQFNHSAQQQQQQLWQEKFQNSLKNLPVNSVSISIERRHSSASETHIQAINSNLNEFKTNSNSLETLSRTVEDSSDDSKEELDDSSNSNHNADSQDPFTQNNSENDRISLISDDIEMLDDDFMQNTPEKSISTSQTEDLQETEEAIEEIEEDLDNNEEPESILPDCSLPIDILPSHVTSHPNDIQMFHVLDSVNQEQILNNASCQVKMEVDEKLDPMRMNSDDPDDEDDDPDDLIIVEEPTDQIEIPDDEEDVNNKPEPSTPTDSANGNSAKTKQKQRPEPNVNDVTMVKNTAQLNKSFNFIKSTLTPTFANPTQPPSSSNSVNKKPKNNNQKDLPNSEIALSNNSKSLINNNGGPNTAASATTFSTMLEMISNFNMLLWKERIGKGRGTKIIFELNEYNLLQIYERCPPRTHPHTAYEKPIYERASLNKDEKYDKLVYLCKRCNCHGSAVDFLAPNFCSLQCLNRDNRKRKRPASVNALNTSTLIKNPNKKLTTQEKDPLLQHIKNLITSTATASSNSSTSSSSTTVCQNQAKRRFRWSKFLNQKLDGSAAPIHFFLNPFPIGHNPFSVGMKLEAIDPENCSLFCICTVVQIKGYRLKLHFDGYDSIHDFWVNADSMDIFPLGWCSKTGRVLQPPKTYEKKTFNLKKYVEYSGTLVASRNLFTHLNSTASDIVNPFKIGMHLEAEDLNDTGKLCVATVADVINDRIRIHFDGWDDCYDYWVHISSPYIHPCGWHEGRQQLIVPPDYESVPFVWEDYIKAMGKGSATTVDLFCVRDPIDFQPDMKLEVVDPRNPSLIRPASIVQRKGHRIKIQLECWPSDYCFWLEDDSPDLHPIGWCYATNDEIEPPPGFMQKPTRKFCSVEGCRGLGNAKNLSKTAHATLEECPYALQNWRTKIQKPPRIRPEEILRAPEETAPFMELKKENLPLLAKQITNVYQKTLLNNGTIMTPSNGLTKMEQQKSLPPMEVLPKPIVVKEESSMVDSNGELKRKSLKLLNGQLLTIIPPRRPPIKEDKKPEDLAEKKNPIQPCQTNGTNDIMDLPLEMKVSKEYLCDYGPRLKQNFKILERNVSCHLNVKTNPLLWTLKQTSDFVETILHSKKMGDSFFKADIDGMAFLMLQQNDLTDILGLKIGPAVKLYTAILQLRIIYLKQYHQKQSSSVMPLVTVSSSSSSTYSIASSSSCSSRSSQSTAT